MDANRVITRGTRDGHHYYMVDGYLMPSPSKIQLAAPFLDKFHAEGAANVLDDNWVDLASSTPSERRRLFLQKTTAEYGRARDAGKLRHRLVEAMLNGEPAKSDDAGAIADAQAAARTFDRFGITPIASELPVVNTNIWSAGTTDGIFEIPSWGPVVLDLKFGEKVWPNHALQLSDYAHMTNTIISVEQWGPRGGARKPIFELGEIPEVRQDLAMILHVTGGVPRMLPIKIDGWVWRTVTAWCAAYWAYDPPTRVSSPGYATPIGEPIEPQNGEN
jgi:hypothetical protein